MHGAINAAQVLFLFSPDAHPEPGCAIAVHGASSENGFNLPDGQVHSRQIIDYLYQETHLSVAQFFYRPSPLFLLRSFDSLHMPPSKELITLENSITRKVADHTD
jgi:hypothetical protein